MLLTAAPVSRSRDMVAWAAEIHDRITDFFTAADRGGTFREDRWTRPGGGGGVTRVLTDGATFEKAGVNRSAVEGAMSPELARTLGAHIDTADPLAFLATGVSVVVHPRSPHIPIVHLNVRYFEIRSALTGEPLDLWFGGGTDLTPTYPHRQDARHFHQVLSDTCARHDPAYYARFKACCDDYFVNRHRSEERRGVGGVFFDNLRPGPGRTEALRAFVSDIGLCLPAAYGPLVDRRRNAPWTERERDFQLVRRGRYVEFNLVHDRGTAFGLQTSARIESVLMSLPPVAAWHYAPTYAPGSFEEDLLDMLQPRDWLSDAA